MNTQNTDILIESLCSDLKPCKKLRHPLKCACGWVFIAVAYSVAAIAFFGLRPDLGLKFHDEVFLFEVGLMLATGASAALATAWLRFPDILGRSWVSAVPYTLFAIFMFWSFLRGMNEGFLTGPLQWDLCIFHAAIFGFVPMLAIIVMSRQGATVVPHTIANMNTLAVTGLGYVGLRVTCPADIVSHTFFYHFLPFIVFGVILGSVAQRLFRW